MSDASNRTWIRHLYTHGCLPHEIVERTRMSKIYVLHAIAKICEDDPNALHQHYHARNTAGEFHFHKSHVVTGRDAYAEGR